MGGLEMGVGVRESREGVQGQRWKVLRHMLGAGRPCGGTEIRVGGIRAS